MTPTETQSGVRCEGPATRTGITPEWPLRFEELPSRTRDWDLHYRRINMRLVVGVLAVLLSSSFAVAEDKPAETKEAPPAKEAAKPAKVPVRVVRILEDTKQALLFDRTNGGSHVLVSVGEKVGIYTVDAIDEDEVTLSANGTQVVLAAPDRSWRRRAIDAEKIAEKPATKPAKTEPAPSDPYATADKGSADKAPIDPYKAPVDPYGDEPVREVKAPHWIEPIDGGNVRSTSADGKTPATPTPTTPATTPRTPPATTPATTTPPATPVAADPALTRREVNAALADFALLTNSVRGSFTPAGVKIDTVLDGSMFARAGLRAGDVITLIDGRPMRSLDDAAALYARASTARLVIAQVIRGGKPTTLRVTIE